MVCRSRQLRMPACTRTRISGRTQTKAFMPREIQLQAALDRHLPAHAECPPSHGDLPGQARKAAAMSAADECSIPATGTLLSG